MVFLHLQEQHRLFLPYRQFHHYHHGLRMWCDYLRCLHSFIKIEIDLCFKFDLITLWEKTRKWKF
jgi:hypothetical protein